MKRSINVALTADGGDRKTVGHRFAHRRQVRRHAAHCLVPADVVAEAGDHLVEDQDNALAVAHRAQTLQKSLLRHQAADVVRNRLQDDAATCSGFAWSVALDVLQVVEATHQRLIDGGLRACPPTQGRV